MSDPKELPHVFGKDMKIGDEMIVGGAHVRIDKIELVIRLKIIGDTGFTTKKHIRAHIPMTDFHNPFPYEQ